ncbi:unnamed protein product [Cyclocybe aegerita]|uniref:Phosphatidate cytidylyltransferase n=1 Tax=Cyclocybe aegerita TaxID=1973307 RepID=A0A8S0VQY7_CYCAE|nr:unnamed protein product [Cyclocybe aegerita]
MSNFTTTRMSGSNGASVRPIFASKTTYEALNVDFGEESNEEHVSEVEDPVPDSAAPESVKMTKSAIKRANRLARIERKQRQKQQKKASSEESKSTTVSGTTTPLVQPELRTEAPVETVAPKPEPIPGAPVAAAPIESQSFEKVHEEKSNGTAHPNRVEVTLAASSQLPAAEKPVVETSDILVDSDTKPGVQQALSPTHGLVMPPSTTESAPPVQDAEQVKKRQNALNRIIWTFIMIGGFIGLLLLGHAYMILLVMLCQTLVYREVTALFSLKTATPEGRDVDQLKGKKDPWSKTLNWYFFAVTNYFLYGESIIYYFKHVVFADANLLPFATNHRMISFTLYIIGFMGFVMSLKRGYLKQQFGLFCWVHMSLLLIVVSSHFIVNSILEGLIWFWVPASLVICNDIFAYIWGITVGRTPLIRLSPKKTVEGFVGAFISTLIFAILWGSYFMRFDYMICPVHDLGVSAWSSTQCTPNPVFVWKTLELWKPLSMILSPAAGRTVGSISYAPYHLHLLVLACFASLVAPFGGFFASGFKRAFNIKDFGHSIPGHGGMTDRMDCQFLMGVFTYVYYSSLIRVHSATVGGIMQIIVSGLTVDQQLELIRDLTRYLERQGITVA